jgi:hypothetical protein
MIDVVVPKGNEKEFIEMAKKLGYSGLCFVYENAKPCSYDFPVYTGFVCKDKMKKADFVFQNSDNRQLVRKRPTAVFGIEGKRDFIHQRDSGLDHVIVKEMYVHKVAYLIPFSHILNSNDRERLIGRMIQNIMLCRKYKVKVMIASFAEHPYEMRNAQDLIAFARTLGAEKPLILNTKQDKEE